MKRTIQQTTRAVLFTVHRIMYERRYRQIMKMNGIANKPMAGEAEWRDKWSMFGKKPGLSQYRLFSHYIGQNLDIVPENICHDYIEPILNPMRFAGYYSDKNVFDKLFPKGYFPKMLIRKMGGKYYTKDYELITELTDVKLNDLLRDSSNGRIVIKPSIDGISGRGVQVFEHSGNTWKGINVNHCLSIDYTDSGGNFIVHEAIEQNEYINQFNPTSVNTLRLSLYRSVKDDVCHVTGAILRIGGKDSVVDNAHAGGCFVGIHEDGSFGHKVFDQYGRSRTMFNNIDFTADYKYPNWENVIMFAKSVGKYIPHHRLIALDIVLDKESSPHLIEFNIIGYSPWLFQYTAAPAFGRYTSEILDYCKQHNNEMEYLLRI